MGDRPRVVVAGLGPAGPDLITAGTLVAIEATSHRYLRTRRHPAASAVPDAEDFDGVYESAPSFEGVYATIARTLVAVAEEHGEVLYLVPGSPVVAEHSVELLLAEEHIVVEVLPALSFLDLAWARLGVDPIARGARLVDGRRFAVEAAGATGPLLVGQCDRPHVLSDIKLSLDEGPPVIVLQRLGLPDESITEVLWDDLDRTVTPDHLTSLWVPELGDPVAGEVARFAELVRTLRAECPWDREQTHASLTRHLLEETYEVLDAIDHLDVEAGTGYEAVEEELGDLLFQIVFHAVLATEAGQFTLADVARGIHDKLHSRHPHVFDPTAAATDAEQLSVDWERRKVTEKGRDSVMDGIPGTLPALAFAAKVQRKAVSQGTDWRTLLTGGDPWAERVLALVDEARVAGIDPELALRRAVQTLSDRYRYRAED
ncbi:MAG: MazG nucleotide pyrophosphohydrolase domain-containing protein [Acidimicrobiales bacterium]|nr:MazG nucleotide pyrophosphohydrolase domain-containing protein [Acidimicrobiales bacterium]